ncbi:MAG: substrate-binding domain-containing protein [Clostridiaceae bacterium]|nr:substrate-binding domain-containing protein [Clostridiaceae bacterium]
MKKITKIIVFLLVSILLISTCACGGDKKEDKKDSEAQEVEDKAEKAEDSKEEAEETEDSKEEAEKAEEAPTEGKKYKIGFNNLLKGAYSLDILERNFVNACEAMGVEPVIVNDEGVIENSPNNVDSMIAAGVEGIVFFGVSDAIFQTIAMKCEQAKVPFVFYDHMPSPDVITQLNDYEYYAGSAGTIDFNTGENAAKYALESGARKAIIATGLITDTTHKARTDGFTDEFVAGGGEVLDTKYSDTELEAAMQSIGDLLTANPDAEFMYLTNGTMGSAGIQIKEQRNLDIPTYVTDLDPDVLEGLKDGTVAAANGAHWTNPTFALALLVNHLNGVEMKQDDGSAAQLVVPVLTLPGELIDLYDHYWIKTGSPYTQEEMASFVDGTTTYNDLQAELDNYTLENRLDKLSELGVVSEEDQELLK